MPRPRKCRKVCCMPRNTHFVPVGVDTAPEDIVVMAVDEYECIRLIAMKVLRRRNALDI